MAGRLKQIHPVLPVKNVSEALEFYYKLGFKLLFSDSDERPFYAGIGRDDIEIHLQWHDSKEWEANMDRPMLRIFSEGVDNLFHEFERQDVFHKNTELRNTGWGTREFGFYDLDLNGLVFYRDVES